MNIKNIMTSAGLVTSLLLSASSQALVMSDSTGFVFGDLLILDSTVDDGPETSITSNMYNLSRFDPSLGVLTSVNFGLESEWVLNGTLGAKGGVKPPFEKPVLPDFSAAHEQEQEEDDDVRRTGGIGYASIDMSVELVGLGSVDEGDSVRNECQGLFLGCFDTETAFGAFTEGGVPVSDPIILAFFTGTAPLDLLLTLQSTAELDKCIGRVNCVQSASSVWGGKLYVEYSYDEKSVPEPSILALLGLGLLGVSGASAFRRRRG